MGGSSTINYMIYTRGNKRDYDRWRDMGNPGWGWEDVLPYFKRLEDVQIPEMRDNSLRGRNGPVTLMFPPYHTPLAESFLESAQELGYEVRDYNGDIQTGIISHPSSTFI
jgi:choline dehydrogenase-like flavoprotein